MGENGEAGRARSSLSGRRMNTNKGELGLFLPTHSLPFYGVSASFVLREYKAVNISQSGPKKKKKSYHSPRALKGN